jgi:DNA-binding Xre family transcriptional regulator
MAINTKWFTDRLAERRLSQRQLAKLMGMDSAAVSLMFRGKRKMTLEEAAQLAVLMQSSTQEVLEAAGVPMNSARLVPVIGVEQVDGTVVLHPEGTHDMVEAPPNLPSDAVAIQVRTAGTERSMFDGWLMYLSERQHTPDKAIDTMALIAMKSDGLKIRHVKRGYKRGTYNISDHRGRTQQNVELAWASPVFWMKTTA